MLSRRTSGLQLGQDGVQQLQLARGTHQLLIVCRHVAVLGCQEQVPASQTHTLKHALLLTGGGAGLLTTKLRLCWLLPRYKSIESRAGARGPGQGLTCLILHAQLHEHGLRVGHQPGTTLFDHVQVHRGIVARKQGRSVSASVDCNAP